MQGIYCFTNKINGKKYIGQSINLEKRYEEHRRNHLNPNYCNYDSKFYRALRKYGFENFEYTILATCNSAQELKDLETYYILQYNSKYDGYNSTLGGEDNPSNHVEIVKKRTQKLLTDPIINAKLSHKGESNGNAKVTEEDVRQIRQLYAQNKTMQEVYQLYKNQLSYSGFQAIWINKSWTTIAQDVYKNKPVANHGGSKLTEEDVRQIRIRCLKNNENRDLVFQEYEHKIGRTGFNKILQYVTWKNVLI